MVSAETDPQERFMEERERATGVVIKVKELVYVKQLDGGGI